MSTSDLEVYECCDSAYFIACPTRIRVRYNCTRFIKRFESLCAHQKQYESYDAAQIKIELKIANSACLVIERRFSKHYPAACCDVHITKARSPMINL